MHPAVTIFKEDAHAVINTEFVIQTVKKDCAFTEGPVWNEAGFYLCSDIPRNCIYKIEPGKDVSIYLQNSGCTPGNQRPLHEQIGSNGLAYDKEGNLFICQHGNGAVAVWDGTFLKPHIATHNGRAFNSPNDLVVHPDGSLFFSDPPYGLKEQKLMPDKYQPVAAMYCYRNGQLQVVTDRYHYPNGVCLSPDGNYLYTCSNKPTEAFVLQFETNSLAFVKQVAAETSDGIKCDKKGNLFLCNREGILILNAAGERLALIKLDTIPANCCWGGESGTDLLVTARENIFLIQNLQQA